MQQEKVTRKRTDVIFRRFGPLPVHLLESLVSQQTLFHLHNGPIPSDVVYEMASIDDLQNRRSGDHNAVFMGSHD